LGFWMIDPREPGSVYRTDVTSILKKCGPIIKEKLKAHGIETVGQLKEQTTLCLGTPVLTKTSTAPFI